MGIKIGRNDPCFCGSGRKYKRCCLGKTAAAPAAKPAIPSVRGEVAKIQESAVARKAAVMALGVFVLFSTSAGDAWLLEVTDMDAIQVARAGERIEVQIEENPETIEINWSHKFAVKDKKFVLTSYKDQSEEIRADYPAHTILSTVKKIRSRIPPELMGNIHLDSEEAAQA
ncbi:YecA family protein [Thiovibrio sp. JS02]|jgi:hypothetical protein